MCMPRCVRACVCVFVCVPVCICVPRPSCHYHPWPPTAHCRFLAVAVFVYVCVVCDALCVCLTVDFLQSLFVYVCVVCDALCVCLKLVVFVSLFPCYC